MPDQAERGMCPRAALDSAERRGSRALSTRFCRRLVRRISGWWLARRASTEGLLCCFWACAPVSPRFPSRMRGMAFVSLSPVSMPRHGLRPATAPAAIV